jgi:hypothetical protein
MEEGKKMKPKQGWGKIICITIAIIFCLQLASCGFVLYPERRGQSHGRVDPAIAVLDGVGLLLFIVPGIVAFAVDFSTGTIYLPSSKRASNTLKEIDEVRVIHMNPDEMNLSKIEETVARHINYPLSLDQENLRVFEWDRTRDIEAELIKVAEFWENIPIKTVAAHYNNY